MPASAAGELELLPGLASAEPVRQTARTRALSERTNSPRRAASLFLRFQKKRALSVGEDFGL